MFRFVGEDTKREQAIALYRVPPLPGDKFSYAGVVCGTMVALDFGASTDQKNSELVEVVVNVTLLMEGVTAHDALKGLAFARRFAEAERVQFDCPALLSGGDLESKGRRPLTAEVQEIWELGATVAGALACLEDRDGVSRGIPASIAQRDVAMADVILQLLTYGEIRAVVTDSDFEAPIPVPGTLEADPADFKCFRVPVPDIAGHPSGLTVEHSIEGATPVELIQAPSGAIRLRCRIDDGEGAIVMRLVA
jgi:hypothetical protein